MGGGDAKQASNSWRAAATLAKGLLTAPSAAALAVDVRLQVRASTDHGHRRGHGCLTRWNVGFAHRSLHAVKKR